MQEKHQIQDLMGVTMEKIRDMVDVQTIIGDPIVVSDTVTIIPVSKVSLHPAVLTCRRRAHRRICSAAVPVPAFPFSRWRFWWCRRTACVCFRWTRAMTFWEAPFARCRVLWNRSAVFLNVARRSRQKP